jgi:CRISPR-associated protein Csm2
MAQRIDEQTMTAIIVDGDAVKLVNSAEVFGRELAVNDGLSKNQIRNVFGEVRRIEADWEEASQSGAGLRRLLLLKPRMAYLRKRDPKSAPLMEMLTSGVDLVAAVPAMDEQYRRFRHFVELFEAILAYHTANERKQS